MKVAINATHGGFGLSPDAIRLYCKKAGIPCYFFNLEYTKDASGKYAPTLVQTDTPVGGLRWSAFSIPNPSEHKDANKFVIDDKFEGKDRANVHLIETIEELGEKANGAFAKLKILEIPDDVQWHIAEYDGWEWVAENHRKWE